MGWWTTLRELKTLWSSTGFSDLVLWFSSHELNPLIFKRVTTQQTMATDFAKAQAIPGSEKASSTEVENGVAGVALDAEANKKLLRRIDWRVMPVVSLPSFHLH